jgi:hypothetical protein
MEASVKSPVGVLVKRCENGSAAPKELAREAVRDAINQGLIAAVVTRDGRLDVAGGKATCGEDGIKVNGRMVIPAGRMSEVVFE